MKITPEQITDDYIMAVEDMVGMGTGAWDMVAPEAIIAAVLSLKDHFLGEKEQNIRIALEMLLNMANENVVDNWNVGGNIKDLAREQREAMAVVREFLEEF